MRFPDHDHPRAGLDGLGPNRLAERSGLAPMEDVGVLPVNFLAVMVLIIWSTPISFCRQALLSPSDSLLLQGAWGLAFD